MGEVQGKFPCRFREIPLYMRVLGEKFREKTPVAVNVIGREFRKNPPVAVSVNISGEVQEKLPCSCEC